MNSDIYVLLLIAAVALGASFVQRVTGFGFGIVAMIFLPSLLLYTEANMLSTILGMLTSLVIVVTVYKHINWKNLIFPLLGSIGANYIAITFMKSAQNKTLTLILGIALFCLSVYFFFFSDRIVIRATWYAGFIAGALSGIMSGLFSISGPPAVIYYVQSEKDKDRYIATVSAYFVLSGSISVAMKAAAGFMTVNVWKGLAAGVIGMFVGALLGSLIGKKTNSKGIKRSVYAVMAISGIINVVTSLI